MEKADTRKAFEACAAAGGLNTELFGDAYASMTTESYWRFWTASRSQALEEAAVIAEVKCDHFPPDQVAAAIRKLGAQE